MAITLKFHADAGLATALASQTYVRDSAGSSPADDRTFYLGSTVAGRTFSALDGVSDVFVEVVDSASGSGVPASAVKLALSAEGLDAAVAGAALNVGHTLLSGAPNSVAIHVRVLTGVLPIGVHADLKLATSGLIEA